MCLRVLRDAPSCATASERAMVRAIDQKGANNISVESTSNLILLNMFITSLAIHLINLILVKYLSRNQKLTVNESNPVRV